MIKYSVVTPIFNEAENLEQLFAEIGEAMATVGEEWELVCIDDASADASLEIIRDHALRDPRVHYIHFAKNCGQSAALTAGFQSALGEYVITLDSDLQNNPADIPRLLPYLEQYDVVTGRRVERNDTLLKRFSAWFANGVRNRFSRETIRDTGCGLKIMKTAYLKRIKMFKGMHRFLPTLMKMEGARVIEVPVSHRARTAGVSKYGTWSRAFSGLRDLLAVRWMQDRFIRYEVEETNVSGQ
jgi:glycosyltransferase involved in cell wall biosynthesis